MSHFLGKFRRKFSVFLLVASLLVVFSSLHLNSDSYAKTYEELQEEIIQKESELDGLEGELQAIENQLNNLQYQANSTDSKLNKTEVKIKEIELKIEKNEKIIQQLEEQINLKDLELTQKQLLTDEKLIHLYVSSRRSRVNLFVENIDAGSFLNDYSYQQSVIGSNVEGISSLQSTLNSLIKEKEGFEKEIKAYEEENKLLAEEKKNLENNLYSISAQISSTANQEAGIRTQIGAVQGQIGDLMKEQQEILDYEYKQMEENSNVDPGPIDPGDYYFAGQGRDMYQGHGLGMSQYGAYGAAQSGMTAAQIIQFYYTGVTVTAGGYGNVEVIGKGVMDIETYVAGLGEVPDKACGTQDQVNSNPVKYAIDRSDTIWDCWPAESIKAQVIAARSYALSKGAPLYNDARDQVYKEGNAKQWAVDETSHQVATYGGSIIRAYYSSDNNQGHGTANHETIWSDYSGNKNPLPYLRSVDDSGFALTGSYTYWAWTTGGFTMDEFNQIMIYERDHFAYANSFISGVLADTGTIIQVDFIRDPSQRTWKVRFVGTNGSREIAGWLFKSMWNDAAYHGIAPGYIYSLTYARLEK